MSWLENNIGVIAEENANPFMDVATDLPLYQGDSGHLPMDTRRVLVQLLAGPMLTAQRNHLLWSILLRDEAMIRSRLSELFLELVLEPEQKVAFTRQVEAEELEYRRLLKTAKLTLLDSALLLHLRQLLASAEARGEQGATSTEDLIEHLILYKPDSSTDHAGFIKKIRASIEKMKNHDILQKMHGIEDRFEISPTLKLLFSADVIQALTHKYQAMIQKGSSDAAPLKESTHHADDKEMEP